MAYSIRPLTKEDEPFLWQMLYEAAHMADNPEPLAAVINNPDLAKYVKDWGRKDDMGFIAIALTSHQPIGAAWIRLLTGDNKGYGYIDDETPELAIAVLPEHRSNGVGTQLIAHLLEAAKASYPSVSLSVRATNPAKRLYERLGFRAVGGSESVNRTGGTSLNMKIDLGLTDGNIQ